MVLIRLEDSSVASNDSANDTASCVMLGWPSEVRPDLFPLVRRHSRSQESWIHEDRRARQSDRASAQALKKLMLKDGLFQEMKRREHYEKPSVKRKQKQARARKKRRKAMKRDSLRNDE